MMWVKWEDRKRRTFNRWLEWKPISTLFRDMQSSEKSFHLTNIRYWLNKSSESRWHFLPFVWMHDYEKGRPYIMKRAYRKREKTEEKLTFDAFGSVLSASSLRVSSSSSNSAMTLTWLRQTPSRSCNSQRRFSISVTNLPWKQSKHGRLRTVKHL